MLIQDVLLIHKKTGFLIQHLSSLPGWKLRERRKRAELISGMLTAIKGLVEEFLPAEKENKGELKEIIHSDHIIKIDSERHTILACVIKLNDKFPDGFDNRL